MGDLLKLNLGCGPQLAAGWVNADVVSYDEWPGLWLPASRNQPTRPDEVGWLIHTPPAYPLPWADCSFGGVVAHHVLQMVAYPDLVPWLSEVRRVLKPGARLRMTLPDLLGAFRAYQEDDRAWFPIAPELEPSADGALCLYLTQAGATRSVFTDWWAVQLCERAGFTNAHAHAAPHTKATTMGPAWLTDLDSRLGESIVVEAQA